MTFNTLILVVLGVFLCTFLVGFAFAFYIVMYIHERRLARAYNEMQFRAMMECTKK